MLNNCTLRTLKPKEEVVKNLNNMVPNKQKYVTVQKAKLADFQ